MTDYGWIEWSEIDTPWQACQAVADALAVGRVVVSFLNCSLPYSSALELMLRVPAKRIRDVELCFMSDDVVSAIRLSLAIVTRSRNGHTG